MMGTSMPKSLQRAVCIARTPNDQTRRSFGVLRQRLEVADGPARRQRRCRCDDGIGVDAVVAIEIRDRAGLPEMLDAERAHAMAVHGAEPGERCRVAVDHGYDSA